MTLSNDKITSIAQRVGDEVKHGFVFNKDGRFSVHEFARAIEAEIRAADGSNSVAADAKPALTLCSNEADGGARCDDQCAECAWASGQPTWDASQVKQPGWQHVEGAFIEGAREARANPEADEAMFRRAADGYTKRVFEEVDPVSEAALRTESWSTQVAADAGPAGSEPDDEMAMTFHRATTDGSIGQEDVDTIKAGLRAVFAIHGAPLPAASEVCKPTTLRCGEVMTQDCVQHGCRHARELAEVAQPGWPTSDAVLVLREAQVESVAKVIYDQWRHISGWVPWVEGGNSLRQSDARDKASDALTSAAPATVMGAGSEDGTPSAVVAGALFDLMGMLTSQDEVVTLSARHDASPAVEQLRKFAAKRGLPLEPCHVVDWTRRLATPTPVPASVMEDKNG